MHSEGRGLKIPTRCASLVVALPGGPSMPILSSLSPANSSCCIRPGHSRSHQNHAIHDPTALQYSRLDPLNTHVRSLHHPAAIRAVSSPGVCFEHAPIRASGWYPEARLVLDTAELQLPGYVHSKSTVGCKALELTWRGRAFWITYGTDPRFTQETG